MTNWYRGAAILVYHLYCTHRQISMVTPKEQFGQILSLLGENSKGITEPKHSMEEMKLARTSRRGSRR